MRAREVADQIVRPAIAHGLQHQIVLELVVGFAIVERPIDDFESVLFHPRANFVRGRRPTARVDQRQMQSRLSNYPPLFDEGFACGLD